LRRAPWWSNGLRIYLRTTSKVRTEHFPSNSNVSADGIAVTGAMVSCELMARDSPKVDAGGSKVYR
jgi:hypothetical protein